MESINIKFSLEPTWFNTAPKIKVAINDQILLDVDLGTKLDFEQTVELEDDSNHQLTFTMYNKTEYDTVVKDGVIEKDTLIKISNIELEDIDFTSMLSLNKELFYYEHDSNGTAPLEKHTLYDTLGCNGTATINFTTPFYIWQSENLYN